MAYPKLVQKSEDLQGIPDPEDFGLDWVVDKIITRFPRKYGDFIEEPNLGGLLGFAKEVLYNPETDIGKIKSNQALLAEFMQDENLASLVMEATIPVISYRHGVGDYFVGHYQRTKAFLLYLDNLAEALSGSNNPQLKALKEHIDGFLASERAHELRTAISDIEKPARIKVTANFAPKNDTFRGIIFDVKDICMTVTFSSGAQYDGRSHWSQMWTEGEEYSWNTFNSKTLKDVTAQVKKKSGTNLAFWEKQASFEMDYDGEAACLVAKTTHKKLDLLRTILSFGRKYRAVETEIGFEEDKPASNLESAIKDVKRTKYEYFLRGFETDIKDFASAVIELRYIAAAAKYFKEMEKKGVPLAVPELNGEGRTRIKGLREPNLVSAKGVDAVVANDAASSPDKNLYLITGTNNNGKTVYMNSIAIAQAMAQAGLMVLAEEADIGVKDNIVTHYIRPGDLAVGESRFAHELSRIRRIFEKAPANSLVLMDEPCSGTCPVDGQKVADDVFRALGRMGATAYVATHFHGVIGTAEELPYAANLHCVAHEDGDGLAYTYRIMEGSSDQSNGIYLARQMSADARGLHTILEERAAREGLHLRNHDSGGK